MSNYELEGERLIELQIGLSVLLILSILISISLSYDELLKQEKRKRIYKSSSKVLTFNRTFSLLIAIGFLFINIKSKPNSELEGNLQLWAAVLTVIAALLVLYVSFIGENEVSLENPEI